MIFSKSKGYAVIKEEEVEKSVLAFDQTLAGLQSQPVTFHVEGATNPGRYQIMPGMTLAQVMEIAGGIPEGRKLKGIHLCSPLGGIFEEGDLDQVIGIELLEAHSLHAGDMQIDILCDDTCMVDYLYRLSSTLLEENCGRCSFCREGLRQIARIAEDITRKKASADDLALLQVLAEGMQEGSYCLFGRSLGALYLQYFDLFGPEIEGHIRRKRCEAMVCRAYLTHHILGSKCVGCEKCLDVCPLDAIEGEEDYIHVIDQFECDSCGKCVKVCDYGAIVVAGAVKPRTPDEPIPVGSWRGR